MLFYLYHNIVSSCLRGFLVLEGSLVIRLNELRGRQRQVGSLAGAAHLLNDNTGVLREAQ